MDLLPCPFCGRTDFLLFSETSSDRSYANGDLLCQVVCSNPVHNGPIDGPAALTPRITGGFTTPNAEAITAWNTRTPSEAVLVEAVQNYVNARDDFRLFERTYPNDSTNRWDRVFEAVNTAEGELRAALAAAKGERV